MKNMKHRAALLGLSLLCASPFLGSTPTASAQPRMQARHPGTVRVLQGNVINDLKGNDFTIRTRRGRIVRVYAEGGEPGSLSRGDLISATGRYRNGAFIARNVTILRQR